MVSVKRVTLVMGLQEGVYCILITLHVDVRGSVNN